MCFVHECMHARLRLVCPCFQAIVSSNIIAGITKFDVVVVYNGVQITCVHELHWY